MNAQPRYAMFIWWSAEDETFLVALPDWNRVAHNPITHGDSYEEAVKNGQEALEALIASMRRQSEPFPEPQAPGALLSW